MIAHLLGHSLCLACHYSSTTSQSHLRRPALRVPRSLRLPVCAASSVRYGLQSGMALWSRTHISTITSLVIACLPCLKGTLEGSVGLWDTPLIRAETQRCPFVTFEHLLKVHLQWMGHGSGIDRLNVCSRARMVEASCANAHSSWRALCLFCA